MTSARRGSSWEADALHVGEGSSTSWWSGLPISGGPGMELLQALRRRERAGFRHDRLRPSELIEKVLALELGAADVVDAPVNVRELAARIARPADPHAGSPCRRTDRPGELDRRHRAAHGDAQIRPRGAAFPGTGGAAQTVRGQPAQGADARRHHRRGAGRKAEAFDRSIDSRIVRLRRKLDTESIATIRGAGYRFDPPGERQP